MKQNDPAKIAAALGSPNAGLVMVGRAARGFFGPVGYPVSPPRGIQPTTTAAQKDQPRRQIQAKGTKMNTPRRKATTKAQFDGLASRRARLRAAEASMKPPRTTTTKARPMYRNAYQSPTQLAELEKRRQILARLDIAEAPRDFFPADDGNRL